MTARWSLLAVALASASACAAGAGRAAPQIAMPPDWPQQVADAHANREALAAWWTNFQDPLLDSLIVRAVHGNLDLRTAAARVREARAARGIAAAGALPQVEASARAGRAQRSDAVPPFTSGSGVAPVFGPRQQNLFEAGFDASWELDLFGGVRLDKEAALAEAQAAEEAQRDVLVTLLADVARTYVELRGTQRQLAILDDTLRSQRDTLGLVTARFEAGLATDLDVARAEALVAATASRRPVLLRLAGEAVHRLGVLLGRDPGALSAELADVAPIPPAPPAIPATLPSELLSRRPDLRRAERDVAAATARVGVARADLFPRFAILGGFGRRSTEAGDLGSAASQFWSIVPGVRWPILSGGRIRANIRVQDARQAQAVHAFEQAVLDALRDVVDALQAYARERERQDALRTSATASRRALDVAVERYTGGVENFLSVLDAQRSVHAADEAVAQSEQNLAVSLIAVYKSLGGGWAPDQAPLPAGGAPSLPWRP